MCASTLTLFRPFPSSFGAVATSQRTVHRIPLLFCVAELDRDDLGVPAQHIPKSPVTLDFSTPSAVYSYLSWTDTKTCAVNKILQLVHDGPKSKKKRVHLSESKPGKSIALTHQTEKR